MLLSSQLVALQQLQMDILRISIDPAHQNEDENDNYPIFTETNYILKFLKTAKFG